MVGARSRARSDHGQVTAAGLRTARADRMAAAMLGQAPDRRADFEAGFERPSVMPADPALVMEHRFEREFVRAKRAAGVGWFNIANMTGKTVCYLKGLYGEAGK